VLVLFVEVVLGVVVLVVELEVYLEVVEVDVEGYLFVVSGVTVVVDEVVDFTGSVFEEVVELVVAGVEVVLADSSNAALRSALSSLDEVVDEGDEYVLLTGEEIVVELVEDRTVEEVVGGSSFFTSLEVELYEEDVFEYDEEGVDVLEYDEEVGVDVLEYDEDGVELEVVDELLIVDVEL
jgi:hypothetical protein